MQYVNRAKHIVFLPLNTGETVHLAAREVSRDLGAPEVDRNARLDRLVKLGVIEVVAESSSPPDKKASTRSSRRVADGE
jgi:hypothetical protein